MNPWSRTVLEHKEKELFFLHDKNHLQAPLNFTAKAAYFGLN